MSDRELKTKIHDPCPKCKHQPTIFVTSETWDDFYEHYEVDGERWECPQCGHIWIDETNVCDLSVM